MGALADVVPATSLGAALGLQVGDVVVKVDRYSVRYYDSDTSQGVPDDQQEHGIYRCIRIVQSTAKVSLDNPIALKVKRGVA